MEDSVIQTRLFDLEWLMETYHIKQFIAMDYKILEKLGEGAFGKVYKSLDRVSQEFVAIKQIIDSEDNFGGISTTTLREISVLSELQHPNIIK